MNKLLYISILLFLIGQLGMSCRQEYYKTYELTYYNGDKETVSIKTIEGNYTWINNGNFYYSNSSYAIRSGVRNFYLIKVDTIKK